MPAARLREELTEAEFHSHRVQMAMDPDPAVKAVHLLKICASLLAGLLNSWGGKVKLTPEQLDPWENLKDRPGADERIALWAETQMGFGEQSRGNECRNPGAEAGR